MLAEVIRTIELFARVAFSKLVDVLEMANAILPVLLRDGDTTLAAPGSRELVPTVAARIGFAWLCRAVMESALIARQCRT